MLRCILDTAHPALIQEEEEEERQSAVVHRAKAMEEVPPAVVVHRAKAVDEVPPAVVVHQTVIVEEVVRGEALMQPSLALLAVVFVPYDVAVGHFPLRLSLSAPILERGLDRQ